MTFTDTELQQLKEYMSPEKWIDGFCPGPMPQNFLGRLISRLDAAEAVAVYARKYAPSTPELIDLLEAWRKAAENCKCSAQNNFSWQRAQFFIAERIRAITLEPK